MGNTSGKQVGDFQAGVGKVSADVGVVTSTIFAVILIIIAIVMAIMALIPVKPWDCPDRVTSARQRVNFMCTGKFQQGCSNAHTDLTNAKEILLYQEQETNFTRWSIIHPPGSTHGLGSSLVEKGSPS